MRPLLLLSLLLVATPAMAEGPSLEHVYKVDDNIYRGPQPNAEDFAVLKQMGIKTVIDLRGGPIHAPRERKKAEAAGLIYVTERFSGIFAPRDKQIAKLVAVMSDPASTPVFIHCRRGADRAGVLIACYRMIHDGWTNEQALAEAKKSGLSRLEVLMRRYLERFDAARFKGAGIPSPLAMMFHFMLGDQLTQHTF